MSEPRIVSVARLMENETVNGTASVYSSLYKIGVGMGTFGYWVKATSASGTPDITIVYEQSYNDDTDNAVTPEGAPDVITITDENEHCGSISPVPLPYIRIKVTGNAANPSDTVVTFYLTSE